MTIYVVIFGAAVRRDGAPSGTLRRRCEHAWRLGCALGTGRVVFLATGGVGRHGPAEAVVMERLLLDQGADPARILLETAATDTLESVRHCTRLLRARADVERVLVASSSYHNPRCALLFRIAGFDAGHAPTPSDRPHLGWAKWLRYVLKECIATPWDALLLTAARLRGTI